MSDYNIKPIDWYSERKLGYTPKHFTIANTALTTEAELWIRSKLEGRYSVTSNLQGGDEFDFLFNMNEFPAFEDPKEAMMYELKWS